MSRPENDSQANGDPEKWRSPKVSGTQDGRTPDVSSKPIQRPVEKKVGRRIDKKNTPEPSKTKDILEWRKNKDYAIRYIVTVDKATTVENMEARARIAASDIFKVLDRFHQLFVFNMTLNDDASTRIIEEISKFLENLDRSRARCLEKGFPNPFPNFLPEEQQAFAARIEANIREVIGLTAKSQQELEEFPIQRELAEIRKKVNEISKKILRNLTDLPTRQFALNYTENFVFKRQKKQDSREKIAEIITEITLLNQRLEQLSQLKNSLTLPLANEMTLQQMQLQFFEALTYLDMTEVVTILMRENTEVQRNFIKTTLRAIESECNMLARHFNEMLSPQRRINWGEPEDLAIDLALGVISFNFILTLTRQFEVPIKNGPRTLRSYQDIYEGTFTNKVSPFIKNRFPDLYQVSLDAFENVLKELSDEVLTPKRSSDE
ncbi:MAG TPA: hypothetical protein VF209_03720 [Patescibacteria group bacterium]